MYDEHEIHPTTKCRSARSQFEYAITKEFLNTKKPILGICGGHQLINIIYGGTLYQDIPSQMESKIQHTQITPPTEASHIIEIIPGTKLHQWHIKNHEYTNSSHHQGIKQIGSGLVANAIAEDGMIEGIEDPQHPYCIGVQWHPEFLINQLDHIIFEKFISACA